MRNRYHVTRTSGITLDACGAREYWAVRDRQTGRIIERWTSRAWARQRAACWNETGPWPAFKATTP